MVNVTKYSSSIPVSFDGGLVAEDGVDGGQRLDGDLRRRRRRVRPEFRTEDDAAVAVGLRTSVERTGRCVDRRDPVRFPAPGDKLRTNFVS